jgi:chitinase
LNCPPASSSSSNSLTINNLQSSSTTEESTSAGLFDYLSATDLSQNNVSPVANAGPNQIAYAYNYVRLDGGNSYDPNGNPLSFSWMQVGGDPVQLSNYS